VAEIQLENLTKVYSDGTKAVSELDLRHANSLPPGNLDDPRPMGERLARRSFTSYHPKPWRPLPGGLLGRAAVGGATSSRSGVSSRPS
jgi:hypothetical protein